MAISAVPAVVAHPYSDFQGQHEEYAYDKFAFIVKDGKIFTIGVRTADPERVWSSFTFGE